MHDFEEERRRLEQRMRGHEHRIEVERRQVMARIERAQAQMNARLEQARNPAAAIIAALEARLAAIKGPWDFLEGPKKRPGRRPRRGRDGEPDPGGVPVEPNRPRDLSGGAAAEMDESR
jgi:hypothetical protein